MRHGDLEQAWTAHGAALQRSLAIDERILRELMLARVRRALSPYAAWRVAEVALGVGFVGAAAAVIAGHPGDPRYLVVAGGAAAFAAGVAGLSARLLLGARRLDYGGAVTAIQRDLAGLRRLEFHALTWAVLGGVAAWLPVLLVAFEAMTGVPALARVPLAWLALNVLLGVAALAAGRWLSRRHVERADAAPWARRLVDAVSGRGLREAAGHLEELSRFEREEPAR